jgi:hypothetical protein
MGVNLVAQMASDPDSLAERGRYVSAIVRALRAESHNKRFVLLDLDNGMGESSRHLARAPRTTTEVTPIGLIPP